MILSVDVINSVEADLTKWDKILYFAQLVIQGFIVAVLAGPPCETWCGARYILLEEGSEGPPPVRSAQHPWGLPGLEMRYRQQVVLANLLMRAAIYLAYVCAVWHVPMLLEHPARNWRPGAPSCWALAEMRRLFKLGNVTTVTFDECVFGQISKKPTTILQISCKSFGARMRDRPDRGRCPHHGHPRVTGRDENGKFKTAQLKEYPTAMSQHIADSFVASWRARAISDTMDYWAAPDALKELYVPLDPYLTDDTTYRHDCWRGSEAERRFTHEVLHLNPGSPGSRRRSALPAPRAPPPQEAGDTSARGGGAEDLPDSSVASPRVHR